MQVAMIRYPNMHNMMSREPISGKVPRSWNIAEEVAHTMRRSMRINLQNVKENRKKSAFSPLQRRTLHPIFKIRRDLDVKFTPLSENITLSKKKCRTMAKTAPNSNRVVSQISVFL